MEAWGRNHLGMARLEEHDILAMLDVNVTEAASTVGL